MPTKPIISRKLVKFLKLEGKKINKKKTTNDGNN